MEARFIGDPANDGDGPNTVPFRGEDFTKNLWRPVSDELGAKLKGHSHFEVRGDALDRDGKDGKGGSFPEDPSKIVIPDDWRTMHPSTMRALASKLKGEAVASKDDAIAAIEAELAIRAAGAPA